MAYRNGLNGPFNGDLNIYSPTALYNGKKLKICLRSSGANWMLTRLAVTLQWQCPLVLLQSGSKPLLVSQWHGPQVGDPHQPLGQWWSILHTHTHTREQLHKSAESGREKTVIERVENLLNHISFWVLTKNKEILSWKQRQKRHCEREEEGRRKRGIKLIKYW